MNWKSKALPCRFLSLVDEFADVDKVIRDHAEPGPADHSLAHRQRLSPCRRLSTLMRPSHPVLHFCPFLNQRFFCSSFSAALLVERLGTETRFTPICFAMATFLAE